jgi:hypothetical protein
LSLAWESCPDLVCTGPDALKDLGGDATRLRVAAAELGTEKLSQQKISIPLFSRPWGILATLNGSLAITISRAQVVALSLPFSLG